MYKWLFSLCLQHSKTKTKVTISDHRHLTSGKVHGTHNSKASCRKIKVGSQTASTWDLSLLQHPADQGPRTKAVLTLTSLRPGNCNSCNKVLASTSVYTPTLSPGLKKHSCKGCFTGRRANEQATWCPWLNSSVQLEGQELKAIGAKFTDWLFSLSKIALIPLTFGYKFLEIMPVFFQSQWVCI